MRYRIEFIMRTLSQFLVASFSVAVVSGQLSPMPVFLMAGQSNMVGVARQAGNLYEKDTGLPGLSLESLVPILIKTNNRKNKRKALVTEILKVDEPVQDERRARREARILLQIKNTWQRLFKNILVEPHPSVYCSFTRPVKFPATAQLRVAQNLSPTAGCGSPWGPELLFGHTLSTYNEFAIAKVAEGGTEIYRNWTKVPGTDYGEGWDALQSRVQNIQSVHPKCATAGSCKWQGFVYFQGENDSFDIDKALGYGGNLTNLVANTRQEMFTAGVDDMFASPQEIPVVIVQLGCWPNGLAHGPVVMAAQQNYVAQTPNTALVRTADLSCFYHFEDAAIAIIGDRIARAMDSLLSSQGCGLKGASCDVNEDCCKNICRRNRCKH